jgi:hypothetical protein
MRNVRGSAMYQMLRLTIAAMAVVFASFPTSAPARVAVTQIKLTEKHVEGFIAAQKGMSAVVDFEQCQCQIPGRAQGGHQEARFQEFCRI